MTTEYKIVGIADSQETVIDSTYDGFEVACFLAKLYSKSTDPFEPFYETIQVRNYTGGILETIHPEEQLWDEA
jgi:hypothetical protein